MNDVYGSAEAEPFLYRPDIPDPEKSASQQGEKRGLCALVDEFRKM